MESCFNRIIAIAINEYNDEKISNLRNCLSDVNELIEILTNRYEIDDVELLANKDQTSKSFIHNRIYDLLINSSEEDNLLLIYAGHGEYNARLQTSYWLAYDSVHNDASSWINTSTILEFMKASPAKHISLVSDSCFSGAIFERMRGGGMSAIEQRRSRNALTSGGIEVVSDGRDNGTSPFASALIEVLSENIEEELSFTSLSEKTIIRFNPAKSQTPLHGALPSAGHEGGSWILRLKNVKNIDEVRDLKLSVNIDPRINFDYECVIPLFPENPLFDHGFINVNIQYLAYHILDEIRKFFFEDREYYIEASREHSLFFEMGYLIHLCNDKFVSVTLSRFDYIGGAHPNNYIYSINFALNPERKIDLLDLIDVSEYGSYEVFLSEKIKQHCDSETQDILLRYITYFAEEEKEFSISEETITIYFLQQLPHVVRAVGFLDIPLTELKLRIS